MRIRKLYPAIAFVTFLIGLTGSYCIRALGDHLIGLYTTADDVPQQELFYETMDSRDVYSAILHQSFIRHRYASVVIETTSADCRLIERDFDTNEAGTVPQLFAREQAAMPVELDTIGDYAHKNESQGELFLQDLGITNELISREEVVQLFGDSGGGWETFYKRYPDSLGLVSFSKVGFNSTHDQAFVYVIRGCHLLCGEGEYVLLNKESGQWVVKVVHEIWSSMPSTDGGLPGA